MHYAMQFAKSWSATHYCPHAPFEMVRSDPLLHPAAALGGLPSHTRPSCSCAVAAPYGDAVTNATLYFVSVIVATF